MLPASHASCEAALRTLLRRPEALAEQSAPPSLQASLQIRLGLNIERSKAMNDNEKLYKLYHRNYKNIEELYDDLSDAILNIGLENNKIIILQNTYCISIFGYC